MLLTCMGEILIDFLPAQEGGKTVGFRMHPGGSPFNVAVGLARLGQPVAFVSKVSTDFFGRFLRAQVESEGIDTRFLLTSDASTTLAFVAMEDGEPAYSFYGEGAADTRLAADDLPAALFAETRVLHIGSISLLRGTTPSAVLAAAGQLKGRALISLDPNVRPGLVRDEAAYRALLDHLFALADIVKVSVADLRWLAPDRPAEAAAADLLARGPALVVVTQGGRGALALRGAAPAGVGVVYSQAPLFSIDVVDTVGAGDAFSAGLLAGLAERNLLSRAQLAELSEDELDGVLRFAAATAALTCGRAGANPPTRAEVAAFLAS